MGKKRLNKYEKKYRNYGKYWKLWKNGDWENMKSYEQYRKI